MRKFKSFFEIFDKNRFSSVMKIALSFGALLLIAGIVSRTFSRYESSTIAHAQADVAFFIIEQGTQENTISLSGLVPSDDPYIYTINVSNFKDNKRCNVRLNYTITFEVTTNLPLTYEIFRNEEYSSDATSIISSSTTITDADNVYYKRFENNDYRYFDYDENQTDYYTIVVHFPLEYKNYPDYYQGGVELFSIIINATQVA